MTNKKHSKKRGFTLIEMLIVIVIIGILAAYLIPRISSAQGKARDVSRKADINQITSALVAYSLDKGSFPVSTGGCVEGLEDALVKGGYISSISKDPSQKGGLFCQTGTSYGYWSNKDHFMIIADLDDYVNANICDDSSDSNNPITSLTQFISTFGAPGSSSSDSSTAVYDGAIAKHVDNSVFLSGKTLINEMAGCTSKATKGYFVYSY